MPIGSWLRRTLKSALQAFTRNVVYEVEYAGVKVKRRGGLEMLRARAFNREEKDFLATLPVHGSTVYDVGAHIGILTVAFARLVGPNGCVVAIEPNPDNCRSIREHLDLNRVTTRVEIVPVGVGDESAAGELVVRKEGTGTGTLDHHISDQIISEGAYDVVPVDVYTIDELVDEWDLPVPDVVKLDVEGFEFQALRGMANTVRASNPSLYIEIHGAGGVEKDANISRVVDLLRDWDYQIVHVETNTPITRQNARVAREGHIYCTRRPPI